ncbi:MAG: hypothetical protein LAP13_24465 [Acidobacteriia bacterium]|nr:hypothetical protein [Terriglobia bacterium]
MTGLIWVLMLPLAVQSSGDQPALSASEIMARVAANQDRAEKMRAEYVYQQHIYVVTRHTNGKLAREETADYIVTPTPDGTKKELVRIDGRYWHKGKYLEFRGTPVPESDSLDGDLVDDFRNDLTRDKTKDGIGRDLFPLTSEEQKRYGFELAGAETFQGHRVYRIKFRPADKHDLTWAGEALIDAEEFQPVSVATRLSRKIPFVVRTLLGTDLPGIGFSVQYRRFDEGIWFPTSFGTEFRLHAVFFINRDISISLENSAFERANVQSKILQYEPTK